MFVAALSGVQQRVAPVLVQYHEGQPTLTVQVRDEQKSFRVDDVTNPWTMRDRFKEVFAFLQPKLVGEEGLELLARDAVQGAA